MSDKDRFIEAKEKGYNWMLVCRDMHDAFDGDGGVYFETYKSRAKVDAKVKKSSGDQKVMGIYDLSITFDEQYSGVKVDDWETGITN